MKCFDKFLSICYTTGRDNLLISLNKMANTKKKHKKGTAWETTSRPVYRKNGTSILVTAVETRDGRVLVTEKNGRQSFVNKNKFERFFSNEKTIK